MPVSLGVKTRKNSVIDMKNILDVVAELRCDLEKVREENEGLKCRVEKLEKQLSSSNKKVQEVVKTTLEKEKESYANKLKENLNLTSGARVSTRTVSDLQDRRLNLVFRGIKELNSESIQDRRHHDEGEILKVVRMGGMPESTFKQTMVTVRRLGKKEVGKDYRPLLVRLTSQDIRERALFLNKQLKEINMENRSQGNTTRYRIDPDLSKEQMDNLEKMWETAKMKTKESKNGMRYFVIGKENPVLRAQPVRETIPQE